MRHGFSDLPTWAGCWGQAGCRGRGDPTHAEWDRLESSSPPGGENLVDHPAVVAPPTTTHQVRTGVRGRDLPERFGPRETVHRRHRRWSADGTWQMPLSRTQSAGDAAGGIGRDVSGGLDSGTSPPACRRREDGVPRRRRAMQAPRVVLPPGHARTRHRRGHESRNTLPQRGPALS
ncbi:transposase [Streptomyces clavifer]|uniref:transposase n=1 Tax=Streptomyces clavifer TaxID=68188 RepID=UPI00367F8F53